MKKLFAAALALTMLAPIAPAFAYRYGSAYYVNVNGRHVHWVQAVKTRVTQDGATVGEVLRYAERMRPREFKSSSIEVGYNGASGEPEYVSIKYWIGSKRLSGHTLIDLGYNAKRVNGKLELSGPVLASSIWRCVS